MSRTAIVAAVLCLVAAAATWVIFSWQMAFVFAWLAVWFVGVERSVGVARFVRFDPWRGRQRRTRVLRYFLVTTASLALAVAFGWAIVRSGSPDLPLIAYTALMTVYSIWAVAYVKAHPEDRSGARS